MSETAVTAGDLPVSAPEPELPRRRRGRTALWAAMAVGALLALFVAVLATRESSASRLAGSPLLGRPAPEVAGTSLVDGGEVRLSGMGGRWVVVNFFATWCIPCQQEHAEFVRFAARHDAAGDASVLMVVWDDTAERVRRFFDEHGGDWPVVADPDTRIGLEYGVRGVPESFLVDPDGRVAARIVGGVTAAGLDRILAGDRP